MGRWIMAVLLGVALGGCSSEGEEPDGIDEPVTGCDCSSANDRSVDVSLDCLCNIHDCPSVEEVLQVKDCTTAPYGRMSSDCGVIRVQWGASHSVASYVYEAETHELLAASVTEENPWGSCNVHT